MLVCPQLEGNCSNVSRVLNPETHTADRFNISVKMTVSQRSIKIVYTY